MGNEGPCGFYHSSERTEPEEQPPHDVSSSQLCQSNSNEKVVTLAAGVSWRYLGGRDPWMSWHSVVGFLDFERVGWGAGCNYVLSLTGIIADCDIRKGDGCKTTHQCRPANAKTFVVVKRRRLERKLLSFLMPSWPVAPQNCSGLALPTTTRLLHMP